ncbi:MAG: hypothetical protein GY849_25000, partial [Deltaproteobacteria bacterium]|nr:hypothetical protein [Deltaproteobacteria bacterium]
MDDYFLNEQVMINKKTRVPNGELLDLTKTGNVNLIMETNETKHQIKLTDVTYGSNIPVNILSVGKLEEKGVELVKEQGKRWLKHIASDQRLVEVEKENDIYLIRVKMKEESAINASVTTGTKKKLKRLTRGDDTNELDPSIQVINEIRKEDVQEATLYEFHIRLGHMGYERIEQLAKKGNHGIKLLDHVRRSCVACAEGKQARANQPKKDSGQGSPIELIGGVICSDL